ncbi:hypothetical protein [Burkholderia phage FLC9]|nr:hypothetical protein [Burkholderia phage FLC9]
MSNEQKIVRIEVPNGRVIPAVIEALILAHRGLGVRADEATKESQESRDDLKLFLTFVTEEGISADETGLVLVRMEGREDILKLISKNENVLIFSLGMREEEGVLYEYIKSITTWLPGEEAIRPADHLMIAPPMYLDERRFMNFLRLIGFSDTDYTGLFSIIDTMIDDYPIAHGADRQQLKASRLFNVSRVTTPLKNKFDDQSGLLLIDVVVADKGVWARAGRLHLKTGWKASGPNWAERMVSLARPKNDEPEQQVMSFRAGVYHYMTCDDIAENIASNGESLQDVLRFHITSQASQLLSSLTQELVAMDRNPGATVEAMRYRMQRLYAPNLIGGPNAHGMVHLDLFTGTQYVGRIQMRTTWLAPVNGLSRTGGLERVDYVETIDAVFFDGETLGQVERRAHRARARHMPSVGWGAMAGGRWVGGMHTQQFAPQQPLGTGMTQQFGECASLSAFSLESYDRVLSALVERMPQKTTVRDVIARMFVLREQINQTQHGNLLYQFDFQPHQGLLMRVVSQSGVTHLQQIIYG